MKKLILSVGAVLLAVALVLFFIIRKPSNGYLNVLPQDAKALLRLNLASLVNELGIDEKEARQLFEKWQMDALGVDLTQPSYGFVSRDGFFGMVIPVQKEAQLKKFLEQNGQEVENQRGFHWTAHESWLVCFDESKCLVMGPASTGEMGPLRNQMYALMSQRRHQVDALSKLDQVAGSVALLANLDVVPQVYSSFLHNLLPKDVDLSEVALCSGLTLDSRTLVLENKLLSENKNVLNNFQVLNELAHPIQGEMVRYRPESPFLFATANIEGEKLLELLRKDKKIRRTLLGLNMVVDADLMIRSMQGDVAFTMPRLSIQNPEFLFCGNLAKQDFLRNVESWKTGLANSFGVQFRVLRDHDFFLKAGSKSGYFGVRDKKLYLTTSQALADEAVRPATNPYLEQTLSSMQACKLFITLDVQQALQALAPFALMMGAQPQAYEAVDALERLELFSSDLSGFTLKVKTRKEIKDIISSLSEK